MCPLDSESIRRILDEIETDPQASQRSLAARLGIALGLANLLVRYAIGEGWVEAVRVEGNRIRYRLTPAGVAEQAQLTREHLRQGLDLYAQARDRVERQFQQLASRWPLLAPRAGQDADRRIVFYGAGEVAEIGYVCLQETDFHLIGVVDESRSKPFFGMPVHRLHELQAGRLAGQPFDCLVVMSFSEIEGIRDTLKSVGFPPDRAFWM